MTPKSILASKTFWLNVVGIIITVLETSDVVNVLPTDAQLMIPAVLGVLNIILRVFTVQPVKVL